MWHQVSSISRAWGDIHSVLWHRNKFCDNNVHSCNLKKRHYFTRIIRQAPQHQSIVLIFMGIRFFFIVSSKNEGKQIDSTISWKCSIEIYFWCTFQCNDHYCQRSLAHLNLHFQWKCSRFFPLQNAISSQLIWCGKSCSYAHFACDKLETRTNTGECCSCQYHHNIMCNHSC